MNIHHIESYCCDTNLGEYREYSIWWEIETRLNTATTTINTAMSVIQYLQRTHMWHMCKCSNSILDGTVGQCYKEEELITWSQGYVQVMLSEIHFKMYVVVQAALVQHICDKNSFAWHYIATWIYNNLANAIQSSKCINLTQCSISDPLNTIQIRSSRTFHSNQSEIQHVDLCTTN